MSDLKQVNIAGGSPAASHFLLLRQKESNQRKGDPGLPPLRVLLGFQPLTTTAYSLRVLRGSLDISPTSGAAQLDLAGRTPRAPLRDSNITSDLAGVVCQFSRMASRFISARLNLRLLAKYRGGAQGKAKRKSKPYGGQQVAHHSQNTSSPVHSNLNPCAKKEKSHDERYKVKKLHHY
jgi:hypothetical protein